MELIDHLDKYLNEGDIQTNSLHQIKRKKHKINYDKIKNVKTRFAIKYLKDDNFKEELDEISLFEILQILDKLWLIRLDDSELPESLHDIFKLSEFPKIKSTRLYTYLLHNVEVNESFVDACPDSDKYMNKILSDHSLIKHWKLFSEKYEYVPDTDYAIPYDEFESDCIKELTYLVARIFEHFNDQIDLGTYETLNIGEYNPDTGELDICSTKGNTRNQILDLFDAIWKLYEIYKCNDLMNCSALLNCFDFISVEDRILWYLRIKQIDLDPRDLSLICESETALEIIINDFGNVIFDNFHNDIIVEECQAPFLKEYLKRYPDDTGKIVIGIYGENPNLTDSLNEIIGFELKQINLDEFIEIAIREKYWDKFD